MKGRLTRYWFEFGVNNSTEARTMPRVGVTAFWLEDARSLVRARLFSRGELPPIGRIVEDVDVQDLDANHVRNQMDPPNLRGIWYPRGYGG